VHLATLDPALQAEIKAILRPWAMPSSAFVMQRVKAMSPAALEEDLQLQQRLLDDVERTAQRLDEAARNETDRVRRMRYREYAGRVRAQLGRWRYANQLTKTIAQLPDVRQATEPPLGAEEAPSPREPQPTVEPPPAVMVEDEDSASRRAKMAELVDALARGQDATSMPTAAVSVPVVVVPEASASSLVEVAAVEPTSLETRAKPVEMEVPLSADGSDDDDARATREDRHEDRVARALRRLARKTPAVGSCDQQREALATGPTKLHHVAAHLAWRVGTPLSEARWASTVPGVGGDDTCALTESDLDVVLVDDALYDDVYVHVTPTLSLRFATPLTVRQWLSGLNGAARWFVPTLYPRGAQLPGNARRVAIASVDDDETRASVHYALVFADDQAPAERVERIRETTDRADGTDVRVWDAHARATSSDLSTTDSDAPAPMPLDPEQRHEQLWTEENMRRLAKQQPELFARIAAAVLYHNDG